MLAVERGRRVDGDDDDDRDELDVEDLGTRGVGRAYTAADLLEMLQNSLGISAAVTKPRMIQRGNR